MTRRRQTESIGAFTLVELLVVVTLMAVAVSMAVFRLDGLSENGRLTSSARQIESMLHLAKTQARATGEPRLIEFEVQRDAMCLRAPKKEADRWRWDEGRIFPMTTGVKIESLIFEDRDSIERNSHTIRVDSEGRYPPCAVVLELHGRFAVVVCDANEGVAHRLVEARPQARDLTALCRELMEPPHAR